MFQRRPIFVRCFIACLMAVPGLLAVSSLSTGSATPIVKAVAGNQPAEITPTIPLGLSLENGSFNELPVNLPGVQSGSVSWGDCNNDGAYDVLLTGQVSPTLKIARAYQKNAGSSYSLAAVFTDVFHSAAAWGDYDNDGWLDVALIGEGTSGPVSRIYHNMQNGTTCTFSTTATNLIGVSDGTVAWGDYNADGQLDLLIAGNNGSQPITKIYRNNHGTFTDSGLNLPGIEHGAAAWGDYDNDGFVDLLLTGSAGGGQPFTQLYHNDGHGALVAVQTDLPALSDTATAWGDYDNDGSLDLLLEGTTITSSHVAEIWRNVGGAFLVNGYAGELKGTFSWTSAAWGDYDTDGYLDALIDTGGSATAYRNELTGSFSAGVTIGSSPLLGGAAAWGDYEDDGNLDVLVAGQDLMGAVTTKIYRYSSPTNVPPYTPTNLTANIVGSSVVLHWLPPLRDDHTPITGLSYNLRVGTQPDGADIISPMALPGTGERLLPALGNTYEAQTVTLRNLQIGQKYYWGVQAIDTSFVGSNFATGTPFLIPYHVFLPITMKDFFPYYTNEWETEPNNTYLQANGPLISGRIYHGLHDDEKDYYSAYLATAGTLTVDMVSPSGDTQLQLFYQVADAAHRVGFDPTSPYQISYTGAPGWYYIYVYTNPAYVGTQTYTLTMTYP